MSLLDKAKETAKKGVDKAKEVGQAGQDKLESEKTKRKINDLKEELGGLVYGQKTGNPAENVDAEIDRVVGEITAAEAAIAAHDDDDAPAEGGPRPAAERVRGSRARAPRQRGRSPTRRRLRTRRSSRSVRSGRPRGGTSRRRRR